MLSRFVIAFLPRSKCLLISWLQSQRVGRDLVTEQQQQICPLFIAVCTCLVHVRHNYYKKKPGDFPGGPVVKTLCFHCSGGCGRWGFNPWFGELTSHMPRGQENHQKNNRGSTTKLLSSVHYFSKCRAHTSFNESFNTLGKLQKKCSTYMVLHSLVVDSDNT